MVQSEKVVHKSHGPGLYLPAGSKNHTTSEALRHPVCGPVGFVARGLQTPGSPLTAPQCVAAGQSASRATPLREGTFPQSSRPTTSGLYVLKFRGAGQGARAVDRRARVRRDRARGRPAQFPTRPNLKRIRQTEPNRRFTRLIRDSAGLNLALDYLRGRSPCRSLPCTSCRRGAGVAVGLNAYLTNVNRTTHNTNMCSRHRHWLNGSAALRSAFPSHAHLEPRRHTPLRRAPGNHVLLPFT